MRFLAPQTRPKKDTDLQDTEPGKSYNHPYTDLELPWGSPLSSENLFQTPMCHGTHRRVFRRHESGCQAPG